MGLFNPILGNIPQPQENSNEVAFKELPKSNYSATVITPLVTELFIKTLQITASGTQSYYTTEDIVITQIVIQGHYNDNAVPGDGSVNVYINSDTIMSLDFIGSGIANDIQNFFLNIPINNSLLRKNTLLRLVTAVNAAGMLTNVSFVGYYYTKQ